MTTETTNKTTLKIRLLKKELKRLAALQRENKYNSRHNQSNYDLIVQKAINIAITEQRIKQNLYRTHAEFYRYTDVYKEAYSEYDKIAKKVPEIDFGFATPFWDNGPKKALTAGYILYNNLREKKHSHIGDKEREHEYSGYVQKWSERIESLLEEEKRDDEAPTPQ